MTEQEGLLFSIGYCAFMLILFLIFQQYPPKKINWFYGYRTKRSMRNETTWQEANRYSLRLSVLFCGYSFVFPVLLYFTYPNYNFILTVIIHTLLILSIYFFTEKHLNRRFDQNGKPH